MSEPAPHEVREDKDEVREEGEPRVVVRDKRRIDPDSGEVRMPAPDPVPQSTALDPQLSDAETRLAERTADLQRLKAEFDNYRKRVERDRAAVAEQALASVLLGLLPVLDDIARAREHGELEGGFKQVADSLERTVEKLGLTTYGTPGDRFDPTVHEAMTHTHSADVGEPTCVAVFQPGYALGQRVLRPARVGVAEREHEETAEVDTS